MFDVAFSEMLVIAIVALIVIGPEKLPKVARTLGSLMGRLQRYVSAVKADVDRELRNEALMKMHADVQQGIADVSSEINQQAQQIQAPVVEATKAVAETVKNDPASGAP